MKSEYYPSVALIGRPNVGKSTLFNALVRENISIVEKTPGVTRDRIIRTVVWEEQQFDIVDTGGIGTVDRKDLVQEITRQIDAGIECADIVIFVVDIQTGCQIIEKEIAKKLHRTQKNVILAANKGDNPDDDTKKYEFLDLGFGEPSVISAKAGRGIAELKSLLIDRIPFSAKEHSDIPDSIPHIALVGRRNAGKSSLVNALADEERVLVSSIPGTTRDAVDVEISRDTIDVVLIDTAGVRKKRKIKNSIEFYGSVRTERSIRRADGVILMIDAVEGIGKLDKQVAGDIIRYCKPCVIAVNKWDLADDTSTDEYLAYVSNRLKAVYYVPVVFISASERDRIWTPIEVMASLLEQSKQKIRTSDLNNLIQDAVKKKRPPPYRGRSPRIFYAVQTAVSPPCFRIFTSDPGHIKDDYRRYIGKYIREHSCFEEIPVKIEFTSRQGNQKTGS